MADNEFAVINKNQFDDPFFVSSSENVSASLVSKPLTGLNNYISWKRGMERALGIKSKLNILRGDFQRPSDPYEIVRWERCDNVILTWIINLVSTTIAESLNHAKTCAQAWNMLEVRFSGSNGSRLLALHREITNLMQGDMSVGEYYNKLTQMWGDEEALDECELCDLGLRCKSTKSMEARKGKAMVMQFLMGLNEVHEQIRTNVVSREPLLSVDEAYSMVLQDEIRKGILKHAVQEASAMYSSQASSNAQLQRAKNKKNMYCTHCESAGHLKERCWKLHGYPPGHKLHNAGNSGNKNVKNTNANNVQRNSAGHDEAADGTMAQLSSFKMSQAQMNKLMAFLNGPNQVAEHIAGTICLNSVKLKRNEWIVDSGATDHVTPYACLLQNLAKLDTPYSVILPNGSNEIVDTIGECWINNDLHLKNVLLIPNFKFSLMSVTQLVKSSECVVHFTNEKCVIQDRARMTHLGTGHVDQGLYKVIQKESKPVLSVRSNNNVILTWHKRLGHMPFDKLLKLLRTHFPDLQTVSDNTFCDICPLARQTRLPFADSTNNAKALFELLHRCLGSI